MLRFAESRLVQLSAIFLLSLIATPLLAQIQYSSSAKCTDVAFTDGKPLDGAILDPALKYCVRLSTGTPPVQFVLDPGSPDQVKPPVENRAPYDWEGGDGHLSTFTEGPHLLTIVGHSELDARFSVTFVVPQPPIPQPVTGTSISWDLPTQNVDGSPLTDLVGIKVYGPNGQVVSLGKVTSWNPPASGTYYMTAYTAKAESVASTSAAFVLATPPPTTDPCKADPLIAKVTGWPGGNSGSRSLTYATNKPITRFELTWPLRVLFTDARGCTASVVR